MKHIYQGDDFSLSIHVDPSFRGILRGFANDVSEGCLLKGETLLEVHRRTRIRSLETIFVGEIRVDFKTTNSVGLPTSDGVEKRHICKRVLKHFNERMIMDGQSEIIKSTMVDPGSYKFPFKFFISASLPHSFEGKNGSIRYRVDVFSIRKLFSSDIHISYPIILRRCLMDSLNPVPSPTQTVDGDMHHDVLRYSATAPTMTYREGGLLTLDLFVHLKDPDRHSVRMITCGLEEQEYYRTTGQQSLTQEAMDHTRKSYPLGCSTFFPSEHEQYDPVQLHNYNAIFRLYPRVHSDTKSSLIAVLHRLNVRIIIDDNQVICREKLKRRPSFESIASKTSIKSVGKTILSHLPFNPQKRNSIPTMTPLDREITPPASPTQSECSRPSIDDNSSVSDSFNNPSSASIDRLNLAEGNLVRVTTSNISTSNTDENQSHCEHSLAMHHHFNPFHFHRKGHQEGTIECTLSLPIIITSREEYKENSMPAIPDYNTAVDEPPSYRATIQSLPPVPSYPITADDEDE